MIPAAYTCLDEQDWEARLRFARESLQACELCPWLCGVDRLEGGQDARCRTGGKAIVAGYSASYGEEPCLTGWAGSGNIYFGHCNLSCVFCHNHDISQDGRGYLATTDELAEIMLFLQGQGCVNLNLITPTHVIPQILLALYMAFKRGLHIPLVYNTSGFERFEILHSLLDGIVDIYLPDFKFMDTGLSGLYMKAESYVEACKASLLEMNRQVGKPVFEDGVMVRGLLIRHMTIPFHRSDTLDVLDWITDHIRPRAWVSILRYQPTPRTRNFPQLSCALTEEAYQNTLHQVALRNLGCVNQSLISLE